jgi:uncharacterized membrane protein
MGAANPAAAAAKAAEVARDMKVGPLKVAAVLGDDVLDYCRANAATLPIMESGLPLSTLQGEVVSANAYLGADNIVDALAKGADIVLTGRVADCSLFLAPMIHEFGWSQSDWDLLGQGQACADMVECGANEVLEDHMVAALAYGQEQIKKLVKLQKDYLLEMEDAVVVTKSAEGKVALHQAVNLTAAGAAGGGMWGALIGLLFLNPLLGAAVGAGAGALSGKLTDIGINDGFLKEVGSTLTPGGAAVGVLVRKVTGDKVLDRLGEFRAKGRVIQTSLSKEQEDMLKSAFEAPSA